MAKQNSVSKDVLTVGVVGAGGIAENMHLPVIKNVSKLRVKFIYDKNYTRSKQMSGPYGGRAIDPDTSIDALPECDVLLLTAPVGVREDYIKEFGRRRTYIFTEKPFAASIDQHERFTNLSSYIACNYMRTEFENVGVIKDIVDAKIFGDIKRITLHETKHGHGTNRGKATYQTKPELSGGGVLIETGSHVLSQLEHILSEFTLAVEKSSIEYVAENLDSHVDTTLIAVNGVNECIVNLKISSVFPFRTTSVFEFEHAKLELDPTSPSSSPRIKGDFSLSELNIEAHSQLARTNKQAAYLRLSNFISGVKEGEYNPVESTSYKTTELISEIISKSK